MIRTINGKEYDFSHKADLIGADLSEADLIDADLEDADLSGADLQYADLRGANLRGATLWKANLEGADLIGADLRGAYLSYANLRWANLIEADLREADLSSADLRTANLRGAKLIGTNLYNAMLGKNNIDSISIEGSKNIINYINGYINIGCLSKTIEEWKKEYKKVGKEQRYSKEEIKEYKAYIDLIDTLYGDKNDIKRSFISNVLHKLIRYTQSN